MKHLFGPNRLPLRYWLSVIFICTGIVANMASHAKLRKATASLQFRQQWTSQLSDLLAESDSVNAQLATLDSMTQLPITLLDEVFKATFVEESVAEFSPADIRDLHAPSQVGWTLVRKELTFTEVPLPALMRFIKTAEKTIPPWRVEKVHLLASPTKPGYARAVVDMSSASRVQ